jgi:hypothetical protein
MKIILLERDSLMATTQELSDEIGRRGLYARKDGVTAKAKQINARAKKYPAMFECTSPGVVKLLVGSEPPS